MAGFSSDKPVIEEKVRTEKDDLVKNVEEEQEVRTEKDDPAKTTDEEEDVRTEEAAPAKTTEEYEDVRTEKDDAVKSVEEQRVRTEEAAPAKTTEEEEQVRSEKDDSSVKNVEEQRVRTEEADSVKTTDEEGVRTVEDAPREEAIESLVESVPNISALNLDQESDERNENPQEDSTMIPRSVQPTNRGSTSFLTNQIPRIGQPTNRRSAPLLPPLSSLLPPPQYRPIIHQTMVFGDDQYRLLAPRLPIYHHTRSRVTERPLQNPSVNQIPQSDQMMIAPAQNNFNQPFGVQQRLPPGWNVSDHIFEAGFDPNDAAWRPQIIRPNETTSSDQQHPMANQLANIAWLQNQTFVPKPLFSALLVYYAPTNLHLTALASLTYRFFPLMGGEANHQNMRRPSFRDDQVLTLTSPSGEPRRFLVLPYHPPVDPEQRIVYSLDDAVVYAPPLPMNSGLQNYQGPHNFFPVEMSIHLAFSNAAAPGPALNHQQRQQHQPQTQDQSPRFDAGESSRQGQDQQQP